MLDRDRPLYNLTFIFYARMEGRNEFAVVEVRVEERGDSTVPVIEEAAERAVVALDAPELRR